MEKRSIILLFFILLLIPIFIFSTQSKTQTFQQSISTQAVRGGCSLTIEGMPKCIDISTSIQNASCSDGTENNACSSRKPFYCSNGNLYEFCNLCGCNQGSACSSGRCIELTCENSNGVCSTTCEDGYINFRLLANSCQPQEITIPDTCEDGTLYDQCNSERTSYCEEGILREKCTLVCPICRDDFYCNPSTDLCEPIFTPVGNTTAICGDTICSLEQGEDCETCPSDCSLGKGQVCCSGIALTGNCCSSLECSPDQQCINNQCCFAECSDDEDCSLIYPDTPGLICKDAGQCNSYCDSPPVAEGSPSALRIITGAIKEIPQTCCIPKKDYSSVFKKYMGYVCPDGTLYNECSRIKPYFCSQGKLISYCSKCGCFYGICQNDNTCKVDEKTKKLIEASLFPRQTDIGARFLGDKLLVPTIITQSEISFKDNKTQLKISGVKLTLAIDEKEREPELGLEIQP